MTDPTIINEVKIKLGDSSLEEGLAWLGERFKSTAKFSTSLGLEDQVLTFLIARHSPLIGIFTLDTGRIFQETYDVLDLTQKKYSKTIRAYFPEPQQVESLLAAKGPNSFYDSVANRKECCYIRKVEPLKRALSDAAIWITGIRADQSGTRGTMEKIAWDEDHQVIKYNPLLEWTLPRIQEFIANNNIPVNTLHKKGFPSIGCAPCTRAILDGEDPRAGRWWWESSNKECGLHETANSTASNSR